jgi:putative effector of murein hydrolase LrgA (UPF0299 family)
MPTALAILIAAQLIGEGLHQGLHLPLPGPVIGLFLLAAALTAENRIIPRPPEPEATPLVKTANVLIKNMGLLFVPAGVGVITQLDLLGQEWRPIAAGLVVSTVLSLIVTGRVMQHFARVSDDKHGAGGA